MKVYISGPVTGTNYEETRRKFDAHKWQLRQLGYEVVSPIDHCTETDDWAEAMRKCIVLMMDCNAIYMMPHWRESRGATIEYELAHKLDFELIK